MKSQNSSDAYLGALPVVSRSGIPCKAKLLFRWLMIAQEVVLVSFLTIRNFLYLSDIRRYWFSLNSNRSELSVCHG